MIAQVKTPNPLLEAALRYCDLGWSVFPLRPRDKKPLIDSWEACQKTRASKDRIRAFWKENPSANIAVATGAISGLVVLDVDGPEGENSIKGKHLPPTPVVVTGEGKHYYFKHPGFPIRNFAGKLPGLDLRGDGGYVVAPPSIHPSGKRYAWADSLSPDEVELAPVPEWVIELAEKQEKGRVTPEEWTVDIPEGQRNVELTRRAGSLLAKGIPPGEVLTMLLAWNREHCKPPLPEKEVEAIVRSIAQREAAKKEAEARVSVSTVEEIHWTDWGNAKRLVARHGKDLRYCHPWAKWLVWDGTRWKEDDTAEVFRKGKDTILAMYAEACDIEDDKKREKFIEFVLKSESHFRLKAMLASAQSEPGIPVVPGELDRDPWLLNVKNGVIDLRTGELRPHRREDMITKLAPVEYDTAARCPRWEQFLFEIMDGNENLVRFLQRAVGWSLTGDVSEHVLFILHGTGRNGKSTFLNTILALMGDYGLAAAPELLMTRNNDRHPTELADLFGKRFVVAIETQEGKRFDESRVKQLTGGDKIRCRRMREDFWEFWPTHKIWLATNHKPQVWGTDLAIWSRLKLIPFEVCFPDGDPRQDKELPKKLLAELPGVLRWAVEGCLMWQKEGLGIPEEVRSATDQYRDQQDVLAPFLRDCCVLSAEAEEQSGNLWEAYQKWCEENAEEPLGKRTFWNKLSEQGFPSVNRGRHCFRRGLRLKTPSELQNDVSTGGAGEEDPF